MELKRDLLHSILQERSRYSQRTRLDRKRYFTATAHRAEKVDSKEHLGGILAGFSQIYKEFGFPIIFPAHPRIVKMIGEFGFKVPEGTILNAVKWRALGQIH